MYYTSVIMYTSMIMATHYEWNNSKEERFPHFVFEFIGQQNISELLTVIGYFDMADFKNC